MNTRRDFLHQVTWGRFRGGCAAEIKIGIPVVVIAGRTRVSRLSYPPAESPKDNCPVHRVRDEDSRVARANRGHQELMARKRMNGGGGPCGAQEDEQTGGQIREAELN